MTLSAIPSWLALEALIDLNTHYSGFFFLLTIAMLTYKGEEDVFIKHIAFVMLLFLFSYSIELLLPCEQNGMGLC
jgi:hypothetical protein